MTGPGAVGLGSACVRAETQGGNQIAEVQTDFDGAYEISGLATGSYIVSFNDCQDRGLVDEYYENAPLRSDAEPVAVLAGAETSAIDAELAAGAAIEGTVIDPDGFPADGACIDVYDADGRRTAGTDVNSDGTYSVDSLAAGTYTVHFEDCNGTSLAGEWWEDEPLRTDATPITVAAGATADGIDAQLERGGQISGDVVDAAGDPIADGCVTVFEATSGAEAEDAGVGNDGHYSVRGLRAGQYKVLFACGNFAAEFYEDESTFAAADPVSLTAGGSEIVNATRGSGGTISGTVTEFSGSPAGGVCVTAIDPAGEEMEVAFGVTDGDGDYTMDGVGTASYKVYFDGSCSDDELPGEYYDDSQTFAGADLVAATVGSDTPGIDAVLGSDAQSPQTTIDSGPSGTITATSATFAFSSSEADSTFECRLDAAAFAPCTSPRALNGLGVGGHTFQVRATDAAGNTDATPATRSFTVAAVQPPPPDDAACKKAQAAEEKAAAKVAKAKKKVKKAEGKEKKKKAKKKLKQAKGKLT